MGLSSFSRPFIVATGLAAAATGLGGCASMTRSEDMTNSTLFVDSKDLLTRVKNIKPGDTVDQVVTALGIKESDMHILDRAGIRAALYGGENTELRGTMDQLEQARQFMATLSGYSLRFKKIEKVLVLSGSSYGSQRTGDDIVVSFVFKDGLLYDTPQVSGGPINSKETEPYIGVIGKAVPKL